MSGVMGLEKGRQREAARAISASADACGQALRTLGQALGDHAAGFRGQGAQAFAATFGDWATSASRLRPSLDRYAQSLAVVDVTSEATDSAASAAVVAAAAGLNL